MLCVEDHLIAVKSEFRERIDLTSDLTFLCIFHPMSRKIWSANQKCFI